MLGLFSFELSVGVKEMCEQIADKLKANSIEYKMKVKKIFVIFM